MVDDKAWEISFQHTSWISIPILWKRMKYFLQTVIMKVKTHQGGQNRQHCGLIIHE